jgi:hypothetical protein
MEKTIVLTLSELQALLKEQRELCSQEAYIKKDTHAALGYSIDYADILNAPLPDLSHLLEAPVSEFLEALEMHIINNEDDWCRNPRTEFEIFKQSVSHLKEKENDLEPSDK